MNLQKKQSMSPLDIPVLIRITMSAEEELSQVMLANNLGLSQSEISKSLNRSRYAGLLAGNYKVMKQALMDFIQYGIKYAFPQQPGALVRGVPTAHSAHPLKEEIQSSEEFVWPHAKGTVRGQAIIPLYPSVVQAALQNPQFHSYLALIDAVRVGKTREKNLAIQLLRRELLNEEYADQQESYY
ncbi:hypothetical protein [Marivirga sp.]|uniref:hypothetical protein n=1 Tax=Marivirga sp. TaxID=2018662 RepID=UPI0025D5A7BB|nr:hypothetical protein [Marivirga sp.]